jgi:hypothetical protein
MITTSISSISVKPLVFLVFMILLYAPFILSLLFQAPFVIPSAPLLSF